MDVIRQANDDIPDVAFSNKLYRMEAVIGKIFEHVKEYPQRPTGCLSSRIIICP